MALEDDMIAKSDGINLADILAPKAHLKCIVTFLISYSSLKHFFLLIHVHRLSYYLIPSMNLYNLEGKIPSVYE